MSVMFVVGFVYTVSVIFVSLGIEDVQKRCDAIKQAIMDLEPIIVYVMRFLFGFLYR